MKSYLSGKVAKIAGVALGIAMLASVASPVLAQTSQSTIDLLLAQIASLQAQLLALQGGGGVQMSCNFTMNLSMGMSNSQVLDVQRFLNAQGATVSTSGAGSPGMETMYFGSRTKAAVMVWQNMHAAQVLAPAGLSGGTGFWGLYSRTFANTQCGGVVVVPPPITTGGSAMVTAGSQPAPSLAPQNAARVPFTRFTVTAGASAITLNSVTVERTGLAQDAVFSGITLLDGNGIQLGIAKTLNSNHQAVVGSDVTIPAGTSMTFTVAGNMASSLTNYAGQVATLSVVGLNTNGTVSGSFPITGAAHTINASLTLGTATLVASGFDPNTATTKNVGDIGLKFAGVRITAGSGEAMRLWSIRWNQSGSAGSTDLANLMVYVDGTAYPVVVSSDGKYFTATFGTGIVIDKGLAKDVYIQGDIVGSGAANRTVQFDIYKTTDIYLTGEVYGYGVVASANGNCATSATTASEFVYSSGSCAGTASTPWFSGSTFTINAGTATSINKANEIAAQNIAVNIPNQILGGYATDFKGEAVTVQSSVFSVATSSGWTGASGVLTGVTIVNQNGAIVAGPVDMASNCTNNCTLTFTDSITYPVGRNIYTIKGKIPSGVANGSTIVMSTTPSSGWTSVVGQTTGNSVSLSSYSTAVTMNTMTIKVGSLAITMSSSPVAQNIVAGAQGATFANFQLDATQSGEDVKVSNLLMTLTYGGPIASGAGNQISDCKLYDGASAITTGNNTYNPTAATTTSPTTKTMTFDSTLTVAKGTVKTLAMKCTLSSLATTNGTHKFGVTTGTGTTDVGSISATGVSSNNTIVPTGATNAGQWLTTSAIGTLVASTDSSSPSYTIVAGGQTGITNGVIRFQGTNEDIRIDKIGFRLTNTASSSPADITSPECPLCKVHLYDGATEIATVEFTGANTMATSTAINGGAGLMVTRDVAKRLTVKVDFAPIGASSPAVQGHLIAVDFWGADATGAQSGAAIYGSGSTAFGGSRLFKSYPTFTRLNLASNTVSNGTDKPLMQFKVTATGGDVGIDKFTINIATTTMNVTDATVNIHCYTVYNATSKTMSSPCTGVSADGQLDNADKTAAGANDAEIYAENSSGTQTPLQVPAGESRYFEVRGTLTSASDAGDTITTTLTGDAAYPSLATFMAQETTIDSDANDDFIWSPNATTTSGVGHVDWTNGYLVDGLPSGGIVESLSR
ncbi:MAG TPA: hypothetical protein VJJ22_03325 [Candidatus Paceibacterota bacterium]